jgi:hypothetical protein
MVHRVTRRLRCAALGLPAVLALTLPACAGGKDVTAPDFDPPHEDPAPLPHEPAPPPPPPPPPPQQQPSVAGTYALATINGSTPGQLVSIANPDGILIGLYRFQAGSSMRVDALQRWSLQLDFSDDKQSFVIGDEGDLVWSAGDEGIALHFRSATYGDAFEGLARNGLLTLEYDFDGDGRPDTVFGFARTGD